MQKGYVQQFLLDYETPLKLARRRYPGLYSNAESLGIDDWDLEQECWLGIMRAAVRYDREYRNEKCLDRPVKFSTFAGRWIGHAMQKAIRARQRSNVRTQAGGTVSGDVLIGESGNRPLWDVIRDSASEDVAREDRIDTLRKRINAALMGLRPREQRIVVMRYGLDGNPPMSLEQISQVEKLTRERIRQITAEAFKVMQGPLKQSCGELLE